MSRRRVILIVDSSLGNWRTHTISKALLPVMIKAMHKPRNGFSVGEMVEQGFHGLMRS